MTVNSPRLWILLGLGLLLGPGCGDDDTDTDTTPVQVDPQWFYTCGDPACRDYEGPFDGVPMCEDLGKTEGDICTDGELTDTCDPVASCNALLICATEDPTQKTGGCPISLAKHKKGIHYLSGEERQGASEDLLNMKLATWQYNEGIDDGSEHLGFIIDDVPGSAAVRPDGGHVDLYGYTSMAVAAIQQQQVELDALKAEIEALKKTCGGAE